MRRAFIREQDLPTDPVPELKAAGGCITHEGLAQIAEKIGKIEQELSRSIYDSEQDRLARDLRYWRHLLETALVREDPLGDEIAFGSIIVIEQRASKQKLRIVGEAEADASKGLVNWRSPLAQALLGGVAGGTVEMVTPLAVEKIVILSDCHPGALSLESADAEKIGGRCKPAAPLHVNANGK